MERQKLLFHGFLYVAIHLNESGGVHILLYIKYQSKVLEYLLIQGFFFIFAIFYIVEY